ncbi:MAG: hypothetical protein ACLQVY_11945 [Limisphaerales bacterium]
MLASNVVYVGSFDNIRFDGPEFDLGGGSVTSFYTSANDSAGWLNIEPANPGGVWVSWFGNGVLQSAPVLTGPWDDVTNAASPFLMESSGFQQFYRLRSSGTD